MPSKMQSPMPDTSLKSSTIHVIAYACGIAGQFDGSNQGPTAVHEHCKQNPSIASNLHWSYWIKDERRFFDLTAAQVLEEVGQHSAVLAEKTATLIQNREFPLLIGGDHSAAAGFWSGISAGYKSKGDIGLIWIDAHMDSHCPETSPNGYVHGMPLASLLGVGNKCLTNLLHSSPKIKPQSLCLIGVRDYEPEEKALLETLGVQIFYAEDVKRLGAAKVFEMAVAIATNSTCGYGVTFDLDSLDPEDAPGVSTPANQGLRATELLPIMSEIALDKRLIGLEISEFNPSNDTDDRTLNLIAKLIGAIVGGRNG